MADEKSEAERPDTVARTLTTVPVELPEAVEVVEVVVVEVVVVVPLDEDEEEEVPTTPAPKEVSEAT